MSYQDRDSAALAIIPNAPADYAGVVAASSGLLYQGPDGGKADVFVTITCTAQVTNGNVVRVFVRINGVTTPFWQIELRRKPVDANSVWQFRVSVPKIELNGSEDAVFISQEGSDNLIATASIGLFQAAA
jgi:hypothetical protein